jgi:hypothetical protein
MGVAVTVNSARADTHEELPGIAGAPYPNMPGIPPTRVRIGKHRSHAPATEYLCLFASDENLGMFHPLGCENRI